MVYSAFISTSRQYLRISHAVAERQACRISDAAR